MPHANETPKPTGKGHATPSRREQEALRKRPLVLDRKADAARIREERRAQLDREHKAMMTGDERNMPSMHAGAPRRFARDFIDARTTIGEFLLPASFIALLSMMFLGLPRGLGRHHARLLRDHHLLDHRIVRRPPRAPQGGDGEVRCRPAPAEIPSLRAHAPVADAAPPHAQAASQTRRVPPLGPSSRCGTSMKSGVMSREFSRRPQGRSGRHVLPRGSRRVARDH